MTAVRSGIKDENGGAIFIEKGGITMITIYKTGALNGLETISDFESGSWVNVVNPSPAEIEEPDFAFQYSPGFSH